MIITLREKQMIARRNISEGVMAAINQLSLFPTSSTVQKQLVLSCPFFPIQ